MQIQSVPTFVETRNRRIRSVMSIAGIYIVICSLAYFVAISFSDSDRGTKVGSLLTLKRSEPGSKKTPVEQVSAHEESSHKKTRNLGFFSRNPTEKFAYATEVHGGTNYLCGAAMLAWTLRNRDPNIDLLAIVSGHLGDSREEHLNAIEYLKKSGYTIRYAPNLMNPFTYYDHHSSGDAKQGGEPVTANHVEKMKERKRSNFSKLNVFALFDYTKVVFIDADMFLARGAPDRLFNLYDGYPKPAGRQIYGNGINSGFMVLRPNMTTYVDMLSKFSELESPKGGDQGFLKEYFNTFHEGFEFLHPHHDIRQITNRWGTYTKPQDRPDPPHQTHIDVYHAFGNKAWDCPRDVYCEENPTQAKKYIWPQMIDLWWTYFDDMAEAQPWVKDDEKYQGYCLQDVDAAYKKWGYVVSKDEMEEMKQNVKPL
eukprot:CAMPEP_0172445668 /NCGR_PEP_ID=MMETSP1065-20121228/5466_1 /TAXON_ID=265537 /ORGANISM="Amphiprora paludosa, Strain CCMP125" /LENGTH=424 /DNA_ID=CAMNT_0013196595 /DNA_START=182 /DNA_END=1456 /DNA_ORIENTATION=-